MDRKLRLYLETTVFNYYFDEDREGHEDVVRLFEAIREGQFEGYVSSYVSDELMAAPEPKRSAMLSLVDEYGIIAIERTAKARYMAGIYRQEGVIPKSQEFDSLHVATATVYGLDCLVSYNFAHINRAKTMLLAANVNRREGYGEVIICTAGEVLENVCNGSY